MPVRRGDVVRLSAAQQRVVNALRTRGELRGMGRRSRRTLTSLAARGVVEIEARTIMVPEVVYDVRRGPNFPVDGVDR